MKNNIQILAYSPLQQGWLTGRYSTVEECPLARRRTRQFKDTEDNWCRHKEDGHEELTLQAINDIKEYSKMIPMA